jgi:diaminohydroxyphosphoribosylaminopyrimidine deaminase/5-amino-6-(5-phosphoribosylamino)uracil reductase
MKVTLKLATSLDGRIATAGGESRWISGPEARGEVHRLRLAHEAILVGVGTVLADDPELTVRLDPPPARQPVRVVMDSRQRIPQGCRLVAGAGAHRTIVLTTQAPAPRLSKAGVTVIQAAERKGRVDPRAALEALERVGVQALMIEGGGEVAASFLLAGLVDALEWFRAPILLGAEGRPAVGALALDALASAPRFRRLSAQAVGEDLWERYERG